MAKRILLIQGHPTPGGGHFGHALAEAYAQGAAAAGHAPTSIAVAELDFPLLRRKVDWENGTPPPAISKAQDAIRDADHLVILYPLWLGGMPALLKGFLEQIARPGFAVGKSETGGFPKGLLVGRSARLVVTMGMPALVYRWYFGAHNLKSLKRDILGVAGIRPIRESLIGVVEGSEARRRAWLEKMRRLGGDAK